MDENFGTHDFGNYPPPDNNELLYHNQSNDFVDDDFMASLTSPHSQTPQLNQQHIDLQQQQQQQQQLHQLPPHQRLLHQQQPHISPNDHQLLHQQQAFQPHISNSPFENSPQTFIQSSMDHTPLGLDQPFNQQGLQHHYTELENLPITTPGMSPNINNDHQYNQQQQPSQQEQQQQQKAQQALNEATNKRTRASGEVLALLVSEFNKNPNPNGATRKRLSEQTGMPERSVRIWFQNRRAKSRKMEKQQADHGDFAVGDSQGLNGVAAYTTRYDNIPTTLNHNYYFIDVKTLTVGSWKRIKSGHLSHDNILSVKNLSNLSPASINEIMHNSTDLMILISKKNNEINYFFSAITEDSKILFRIFYPISSINNCSISTVQENDDTATPDSTGASTTNNNNNNNIASCDLKLFLNKPPKFAVAFANMINDNNNQWSICDDFSEGHQVNDAYIGGTGIPHVFTGSLTSLKFMNSHILDYKSTNTQDQEFSLPSRFDSVSPVQYTNPIHSNIPAQPQPQLHQQLPPPPQQPHFNPSVFTDASTAPTAANGSNSNSNQQQQQQQQPNQFDNLIKNEGHEFDAFIRQDYGSHEIDPLTPQNF